MALQIGFEGSPRDWCSEFTKLCRDYEQEGPDPRGLSQRAVYDILEDGSKHGGFLDDADVRDLLKRWASGDVGEGSKYDLEVEEILRTGGPAGPVDAPVMSSGSGGADPTALGGQGMERRQQEPRASVNPVVASKLRAPVPK